MHEDEGGASFRSNMVHFVTVTLTEERDDVNDHRLDGPFVIDLCALLD
jgi:hypothetical protein